MALAAAGWMNPIIAAIAMMGSSLFVISNSLRIARVDETKSSAELNSPAHHRVEQADVSVAAAVPNNSGSEGQAA